MAKKKVMLFIVEGPTDETSLSTVLNRIFSSSTVKFQVVHGDILTRDFTSSDKIVAAVWEQVKEFMGSIYRKGDICRIVHLTDMDGVFIPDDAVIKDDSMEIDDSPYYTKTQIQTPNRAGILNRNQHKRDNINRLSACPKIAGIPYSMYYFSLNLEHILHGRTNLSDWEKIRCAEEFDLKYGDDPDGFTLFMKESSFSICDDYCSSWAFIKTELHSLERYSNFGIELPSLGLTESETDNWFLARRTETKDLQAMDRDVPLDNFASLIVRQSIPFPLVGRPRKILMDVFGCRRLPAVMAIYP